MGRRKTPSPVKRRNPMHDAPMLRKCDVHGKTRKAQRRNDKVAFKKEWCSPWGRVLAFIDNTIQAAGLAADHEQTLSRVPAGPMV
jgi:hypothetical protein